MTNKMNADFLELVREKTGRVNGNLLALLTILKGTPTGYNSDTQETKKAVMDTTETVKTSLDIISDAIVEIKWDGQKGEELIRKGYARATLLTDKLATQGMPFREAHEKVGKLVKKLQKEGRYLEHLTAKEEKELRD